MQGKKDLELIAELMEQLQGDMEYGKDDLARRLGREEEPKPEVMVMKIEGKDQMPKAKGLREDLEHEMMGGQDEESPEDERMEMQPGDMRPDMDSRSMDRRPQLASGLTEEQAGMMGEESPEDKLKARLMKLRS